MYWHHEGKSARYPSHRLVLRQAANQPGVTPQEATSRQKTAATVFQHQKRTTYAVKWRKGSRSTRLIQIDPKILLPHLIIRNYEEWWSQSQLHNNWPGGVIEELGKTEIAAKYWHSLYAISLSRVPIANLLPHLSAIVNIAPGGKLSVTSVNLPLCPRVLVIPSFRANIGVTATVNLAMLAIPTSKRNLGATAMANLVLLHQGCWWSLLTGAEMQWRSSA